MSAKITSLSPQKRDEIHRLDRWILQSAARDLQPNGRITICYRRVVPKKLPKVMHSKAVHRAHYKNLMICGRVWTCPVCAGKITERRRIELTEAVDHHPQFAIALVTLTVQHKQSDKLSALLDDLLASYRRLKAGRWWADLESDYGIIGSIRALEVTHGANGWHPHLHALFFCDRNRVDWQGLQDLLKVRWREVLARNERTATYRHGVDVRTANRDVADYIAKFGREPVNLKRPGKWTIEHELTKAAVKQARNAEGRTPTQLLADYIGGDKHAGALWQEYAACFKGKRQLVWSNGLRGLLGLDVEKSDEQLAREEREDADVLVVLTLSQWAVILANDARGEVLQLAHTGNAQTVQDFVDQLTTARSSRRAYSGPTSRLVAQKGIGTWENAK